MFDYSYFTALSEGEERLKYLKKCIDEADKEKDYESALDLRYEYIKESVFNEDNFKSLIMFPEYMALFDAHPDVHDYRSFMTAFKWVIEDITYFYQISVEKAEEYFEEFRKRCLKYGLSLRTYYMKKAFFYSKVSPDKASELIKPFRESERDELSDCFACEASFDIHLELEFGSEEKAIAMLRDMIRRNISCAKVPEDTYGECVEHFTRTGNLKEAEHYAELLMPMIKTNNNFLMEISQIMLLKAFTNPNAAYSIFCRYTELFCKTKNPAMRFWFAHASARFFEGIEAPEQPTIKMKLPRTFELYSESGEYDIAEMKAYFRGIAKDIAEKFDKRSGNSYYSDILNYEYPAEPVRKLDMPEHGTAPKTPATIAVPYKSADTLPSLETIIDTFKALPDTEFYGVSADEESNVVSVSVYNKKTESEFLCKLFIRDAEDFDSFRPMHVIPDDKLSCFAENFTVMIVMASIHNKGCEDDEFNMLLKLADSINTDNSPAIIELSNGFLLSSAWVKIQAEGSLPALEKYMYGIHGYPSEIQEQRYDIITSGLQKFGSRELLVVGLEEDDIDFACNVISQIAEFVCGVSDLRDEGDVTEFGVIYNNESEVLFSWISAEKAYPGLNIENSENMAVPVLYLSSADAENGSGMLLNEVPEEIQEKLEFRNSNRHFRTEAALARKNFKYALSAFRDGGDELIVGFYADIPQGFDEEYGDTGEIYISVENDGGKEISGIIVTGIDDIPELRTGRKISADPERIMFWRLELGGDYYFADHAYLLV